MRPIVPGMVIDGFTVGQSVHAGAMGTLFEVTRAGAAFPMLMKVPSLGERADSAELLLAFETEAMILPRLSGPHVPRFVAVGDVTVAPHLVIERVAGESLDRRTPRALPHARWRGSARRSQMRCMACIRKARSTST
jgi:hypothetical protein